MLFDQVHRRFEKALHISIGGKVLDPGVKDRPVFSRLPQLLQIHLASRHDLSNAARAFKDVEWSGKALLRQEGGENTSISPVRSPQIFGHARGK